MKRLLIAASLLTVLTAGIEPSTNQSTEPGPTCAECWLPQREWGLMNLTNTTILD
jgi:hypothetical protein